MKTALVTLAKAVHPPEHVSSTEDDEGLVVHLAFERREDSEAFLQAMTRWAQEQR